jgi:hypothetical protein
MGHVPPERRCLPSLRTQTSALNVPFPDFNSVFPTFTRNGGYFIDLYDMRASRFGMQSKRRNRFRGRITFAMALHHDGEPDTRTYLNQDVIKDFSVGDYNHLGQAGRFYLMCLVQEYATLIVTNHEMQPALPLTIRKETIRLLSQICDLAFEEDSER